MRGLDAIDRPVQSSDQSAANRRGNGAARKTRIRERRTVLKPFAARGKGKSNTADAEILYDDVLIDAVIRSLAADARLLDPAEWRDFGRDNAGIDADNPILERFGDAPDAA